MARFTPALSLLVGSLLAAAAPSVAAAQPGAPEPVVAPAPPPPPPPAPPAAGPVEYEAPAPAPAAVIVVPPPPSTVDVGVLEDANSGRAWLSPTALTMPKGSWAFTDSELILVGLSYGITDTVQIGVGTMVPIVRDQPFVGTLTGKAQVMKSGRLRLAAHATITHFGGGKDDLDDEDFGFTLGQLGGVATSCIDDACRSHASLYVGTAYAFSDADGQFPIFFAGSITAALSKHVKFVGEIDSGLVPGEDFENVYLGWYGVRFTSGQMAGDIGFVRPFGDEVDNGGLVAGVPWINFTYRAL